MKRGAGGLGYLAARERTQKGPGGRAFGLGQCRLDFSTWNGSRLILPRTCTVRRAFMRAALIALSPSHKSCSLRLLLGPFLPAPPVFARPPPLRPCFCRAALGRQVAAGQHCFLRVEQLPLIVLWTAAMLPSVKFKQCAVSWEGRGFSALGDVERVVRIRAGIVWFLEHLTWRLTWRRRVLRSSCHKFRKRGE